MVLNDLGDPKLFTKRFDFLETTERSKFTGGDILIGEPQNLSIQNLLGTVLQKVNQSRISNISVKNAQSSNLNVKLMQLATLFQIFVYLCNFPSYLENETQNIRQTVFFNLNVQTIELLSNTLILFKLLKINRIISKINNFRIIFKNYISICISEILLDTIFQINWNINQNKTIRSGRRRFSNLLKKMTEATIVRQ